MVFGLVSMFGLGWEMWEMGEAVLAGSLFSPPTLFFSLLFSFSILSFFRNEKLDEGWSRCGVGDGNEK